MNTTPIIDILWIWHSVDVLFVLKIWGIALLVNAIGWPIAMWLGGYWRK
jgi:hypothetical protein